MTFKRKINIKSNRLHIYPQVLDALEIAFKEIDSEDSFADNSNIENTDKINKYIETPINAEITSIAKKEHKIDEKNINPAPLYENIDIFYRNGGVDAFPLDLPANVLEPPKEKPPPPPVDDATDELLGNVSN